MKTFAWTKGYQAKRFGARAEGCNVSFADKAEVKIVHGYLNCDRLRFCIGLKAGSFYTRLANGIARLSNDPELNSQN